MGPEQSPEEEDPPNMREDTRGFASDNAAGVHPAVLDAINAASAGHAHAYGDDRWTARAEELFRQHFGEQAQAFIVFNGTGANVTALQALVRPYEAVICPATAHINVDECGAPGRFTGGRLFPVATADGKLTPELIEGAITRVGDQHASQPRAVSITQSTEYGTVYSAAELGAIAAVARRHGLKMHVDGARLANAAASLGSGLREACAGADVVSFGGTKNGAMIAEAVIFLDPALADDFRYIRKQSTQLASKMRFVSAQFVALLEGDLWRENAAHANAMASLLAGLVRDVPGVQVTKPVQANEIFAVLPLDAVGELQAAFDFYSWDERSGEVRWVTSWDTTEEDVRRFAEAIVRRLG